MKESMVEFRKVSKKLGKKQVLNEVDLMVASGEVIGIIGANGSGKTTLLRLVTGLMYPDKGQILVDGKNVRPGLIGSLPVSVRALIESPAFLPQFSGLKNLTMLADIRGEIDEQTVRKTMERVDLDPNNRKAVKTYSFGMNQRLGIAQAIMEKPNVLLLDEPTNGLDEDGLKMFASIMQEQVAHNVAVILVSHVKEEIARYCDRVFTIQDGHLQITRDQRERKWIIVTKDLADLESIYHLIPSFEMSQRVEGHPAGMCNGEWANKEELISFLTKKDINPMDVKEVI